MAGKKYDTTEPYKVKATPEKLVFDGRPRLFAATLDAAFTLAADRIDGREHLAQVALCIMWGRPCVVATNGKLLGVFWLDGLAGAKPAPKADRVVIAAMTRDEWRAPRALIRAFPASDFGRLAFEAGRLAYSRAPFVGLLETGEAEKVALFKVGAERERVPPFDKVITPPRQGGLSYGAAASTVFGMMCFRAMQAHHVALLDSARMPATFEANYGGELDAILLGSEHSLCVVMPMRVDAENHAFTRALWAQKAG